MYLFYILLLLVCLVIHLESVSLHPYQAIHKLASKPERMTIEPYKMPDSCKDTKKWNYCFSNESYPIDVVKKLLANFNTLSFQHADQLIHRSSCGDGCTHKIYYVVDKDSRERVVAQVEGNFTQSYTVRTCRPEDNPTKHFWKPKMGKHNITCTETKMDYSFLVLKYKPDYHGNYELETITTKIPVCCACRNDKPL